MYTSYSHAVPSSQPPATNQADWITQEDPEQVRPRTPPPEYQEFLGPDEAQLPPYIDDKGHVSGPKGDAYGKGEKDPLPIVPSRAAAKNFAKLHHCDGVVASVLKFENSTIFSAQQKDGIEQFCRVYGGSIGLAHQLEALAGCRFRLLLDNHEASASDLTAMKRDIRKYVELMRYIPNQGIDIVTGDGKLHRVMAKDGSTNILEQLDRVFDTIQSVNTHIPLPDIYERMIGDTVRTGEGERTIPFTFTARKIDDKTAKQLALAVINSPHDIVSPQFSPRDKAQVFSFGKGAQSNNAWNYLDLLVGNKASVIFPYKYEKSIVEERQSPKFPYTEGIHIFHSILAANSPRFWNGIAQERIFGRDELQNHLSMYIDKDAYAQFFNSSYLRQTAYFIKNEIRIQRRERQLEANTFKHYGYGDPNSYDTETREQFLNAVHGEVIPRILGSNLNRDRWNLTGGSWQFSSQLARGNAYLDAALQADAHLFAFKNQKITSTRTKDGSIADVPGLAERIEEYRDIVGKEKWEHIERSINHLCEQKGIPIGAGIRLFHRCTAFTETLLDNSGSMGRMPGQGGLFLGYFTRMQELRARKETNADWLSHLPIQGAAVAWINDEFGYPNSQFKDLRSPSTNRQFQSEFHTALSHPITGGTPVIGLQELAMKRAREREREHDMETFVDFSTDGEPNDHVSAIRANLDYDPSLYSPPTNLSYALGGLANTEITQRAIDVLHSDQVRAVIYSLANRPEKAFVTIDECSSDPADTFWTNFAEEVLQGVTTVDDAFTQLMKILHYQGPTFVRAICTREMLQLEELIGAKDPALHNIDEDHMLSWNEIRAFGMPMPAEVYDQYFREAFARQCVSGSEKFPVRSVASYTPQAWENKLPLTTVSEYPAVMPSGSTGRDSHVRTRLLGMLHKPDHSSRAESSAANSEPARDNQAASSSTSKSRSRGLGKFSLFHRGDADKNG